MRRIAALVIALIALASPRASAQVTAEPGSELAVFLATYGPGAAVWEQFGHNSLWIHDASVMTTVTYNYGMFDFDAPGFYPRFLRGRMIYQMGSFNADTEA